jgi:hypothetical protein
MRTLEVEIFNTHLTVWAGENAAVCLIESLHVSV